MSWDIAKETAVQEKLSESKDNALGRRDLLRLAGALGLTSSFAALTEGASSGHGGGIEPSQFEVARKLAQRIAANRTELQAFRDRVKRMSTQLESRVSLDRAAGEFAQAYPELKHGEQSAGPETTALVVVIIIIILLLIPLAAQ